MDLVGILNKLNDTPNDRFRVIRQIRFEKNNCFFSVQASQYHYCSPREFLPFEKYTHFEVMTDIPEKDIPSDWSEYGGNGDPYSWMPKEKIEKLLTELDEKYILVY